MVQQSQDPAHSRIICPHNGIQFPTLWHGLNTITQNDLNRFLEPGQQIPENGPRAQPGIFHYYSIAENPKAAESHIVGTTIWTPVTVLDPNATPYSFFIRHHQSAELAEAYFLGFFDNAIHPFDTETSEDELLGFRNTNAGTVTTAQGTFTLIPIPTPPAAPGPLITYAYQYPATLNDGTEIDLLEEWCITI